MTDCPNCGSKQETHQTRMVPVSYREVDMETPQHVTYCSVCKSSKHFPEQSNRNHEILEEWKDLVDRKTGNSYEKSVSRISRRFQDIREGKEKDLEVSPNCTILK